MSKEAIRQTKKGVEKHYQCTKRTKYLKCSKNKSKTQITARDIAQKEKTTGSTSIHKDRQWGNRQWKVKSINGGIS